MSLISKIGSIMNSVLILVLAVTITGSAKPVLAVASCGTGSWVPGNLEIHHINIGQGDSTLVVGPGGKSLLFDAGESNWNSSAKARIIGPYIETVLGCKSIDYVVISHFHLDHIGYVGYGGLWHLVETQGFTVGTTLVRDYETYLGNTSGTFTNWKNYLDGVGQTKLHPITALAGVGQVNLGTGVTFNIATLDGNDAIIPGNFSGDASPPSENDFSIGAVISYGDFDEWIGGDLDGQYEVGGFGYTYHDIELSVALKVGDVDVYKANHHASSHSSSATFINQLDPEVSIVTVGNGNTYGHPTQSIMDRLLAASTVYMTERGDLNTNIGSAIVAGHIIIKTTGGASYTVNGTIYAATEPPRLDSDGDGYFVEADPNDNNFGLVPGPNGGCGSLYQTCSIACEVTAGQVLINEVLPSPSSGPEWVELFNTTADTINLGYCHIDDLAAGSPAYQIPAGTLIPAHGFWAVDRTNYFNNTGDDVRFLTEDASTVLDSFIYSSTASDVSWYRFPDGQNWAASPTISTTKGLSNNTPFPPFILSSVRANPSPTGAVNVNFIVTFSENVSGVNVSHPFDDFDLTTTGVVGATIAAVSGSGNIYTVTVNRGSGNGTIRLDVIDDDSIRDLNNNPLGGSGNGSFSSGELYVIDENKVFDNGIWWVEKGNAPVVRSEMDIYLNGMYQGATRLLRYGHKKDGLGSWPEVAAIYNTGYVRLVPYDLTYGTSFILGPSYWEDTGTGTRYFHDLQISRIDIDTSLISQVDGKGPIQLTIYARDYRDGYWPDYHLDITYNIILSDPDTTAVKMQVLESYSVANAFSLSSSRQSNHEGFKLMQFSSMYIDGNFHDSDGAQFPGQSGNLLSKEFATVGCGSIIFNAAQALSTDNPWVQVRHNDDLGWQGNTPNTHVYINTPNLAGEIIPQGYITCSNDENDDNVGVWLNHESAPINFIQGYTGFVEYTLVSQDDPKVLSASVDVTIGGSPAGNYSLDSGERVSPRYGINGGPVRVVSTNAQPILTSQRAVFGNSFNSIVGVPANQLTTEYWFTSLDDLGMITYLVIGNPSTTQTALVDVYIAGVKKNSTPYSIAPGQRVFPRYGINGGPVRVVSDIPIFTSERTKYGNSFNEVLGYPANQLTTEYWFTSLDDLGMITYLVIGNPSTMETALVDVYIAGNKMNPTPYAILPGQRVFPRYGINGGPVRVVSTNGVAIFTSERTKYQNSFNEVLGYAGNKLATEYWFTSLDDASMITYLVIGNPSTTLTAHVDVYINGIKQNTTPYAIAPGQRVFPRYGVNSGAVRVVSDIPIFTSERTKYLSSFNEILGLPANQLTTEYWFTSLDDLGMATELVIAAP